MSSHVGDYYKPLIFSERDRRTMFLSIPLTLTGLVSRVTDVIRGRGRITKGLHIAFTQSNILCLIEL